MTVEARPHRLWTIAATIGVLAFGFRLMNVRDLPNDHYMHLAWAQQLLFGERPGRDFVDPGMPLTYLLSALVQWLWAGPFSEAVLCCVMLAITAAVVFVVSTELTGSRIAGVLAAAVVVGFYPRLYSYPKVLVPAVALYLLHRYAVLPRMSRLWLLAIWIAAATLLRHDLGVYAAAGTGAGLLSVHWGSVRASISALARCAGAVIAVMIPYLIFVQWSEGVFQHLHQAVEFARGEAHQRFLAPPPFPFFGDARGLAAWSIDDSAVLLFYLAYLIPLVALVLVLRRARPQPVTASVSAALAMSALYLLVVLRHPIVSRIQDVATLFAILGVWTIADAKREGKVAFAAALLVCALGAASIWHLGNLTERVRDTRVADGPGVMQRTIQGIEETGTQWPWERYWPAGELPEAIKYLNACTAPTDKVLLTWAAPEYYYFARRPFGAGHALFLPPDAFTNREDQELMLARMVRERIPVILINETRAKEFTDAYGQVDRYLRQAYVPAGHFQIRDGSEITIATRRDLKAERTYGADRWPCDFDSRAASRTASIMLDGSAIPLPAISNAVP